MDSKKELGENLLIDTIRKATEHGECVLPAYTPSGTRVDVTFSSEASGKIFISFSQDIFMRQLEVIAREKGLRFDGLTEEEEI